MTKGIAGEPCPHDALLSGSAAMKSWEQGWPAIAVCQLTPMGSATYRNTHPAIGHHHRTHHETGSVRGQERDDFRNFTG